MPELPIRLCKIAALDGAGARTGGRAGGTTRRSGWTAFTG
jgi:hypothetical protein